MCRCMMRVKITVGMAWITDAAAINSQKVLPVVTNDEMTTGKVFVARVVRKRANNNSFQAKMNTNVATVAMPLFERGSATFRKV